ncbi:proline dehydrogenase [Paenibacillus marchantiophytorum]|uniref:proline dehydrogenase n=1 Tax=Paenibacillus marchantiophytorum TaxID=1619310 RepID=A0ABQ1FIP7_9BACL|nr:proline dehydrogenase family protein [Paenibacillus marchantiophytorum]GGA13924.1 proline dehydrogenase [Paenibacillus marchantiophytorum]
MNDAELRIIASQALKSIARNEHIQTYIQESKDLYPLFFRAAQRFITGETRDKAVSEALDFKWKGYAVSLEYIGENTTTQEACELAQEEYLKLIRTSGESGLQATISLDLSHIGLTVNPELSRDHLAQLAQEAARYGSTVMISAEESAKTDQILEIYKHVGDKFPNVGITLHAQLHRTESDLLDIKSYPGRIRIVKGAYQEPQEIALPRSEELNERYLHLTKLLVASGRPVSIASHDEVIIEAARKRGYLAQPNVEIEMLYGIRPDLLKKLKEAGCRTKVYVLYGKEWHLYVCHRLSEFPPNLYRALADIAAPFPSKESLY